MSPAQAFLASIGGRTDPGTDDSAPEPNPDDEGQAIGLNDEYVIGRTVSHGGFGVIKEVHSIKGDGKPEIRAVKIVRKDLEGVDETKNEYVQQELEHEISVWRHLNHPHILALRAVYDTEFATFCIMDLNVGGTLHDVVRESRLMANKNDGRKGLPPHLAKRYSYQLACALRYLHEDIRVCHRDIKLENCLIDMTGPDARTKGGFLRLCDFGLADFLHSEQVSLSKSPSEEHFGSPDSSGIMTRSFELPMLTGSSVIGTLEYASPRGLAAHRKLYETAGDIWAFGVIVYALCTGELPFRHPMPSKTAGLILRAEWDDTALRRAADAGGSDDRRDEQEVVIDLVHGCLEKDIDLRHTINDVLRSPWFADCREEDEPAAGWR